MIKSDLELSFRTVRDGALVTRATEVILSGEVKSWPRVDRQKSTL